MIEWSLMVVLFLFFLFIYTTQHYTVLYSISVWLISSVNEWLMNGMNACTSLLNLGDRCKSTRINSPRWTVDLRVWMTASPGGRSPFTRASDTYSYVRVSAGLDGVHVMYCTARQSRSRGWLWVGDGVGRHDIKHTDTTTTTALSRVDLWIWECYFLQPNPHLTFGEMLLSLSSPQSDPNPQPSISTTATST